MINSEFLQRQSRDLYTPENSSARNISGTVERIRCYKPDSTWAAVTIRTGERCIQATGLMPGVTEGMTVELTGRFVDTNWGPSFKAETFIEKRPSDSVGIEKYLGSGLIKNIGPELARRIVEQFGEETLDVLDNHPERLKEVHGLGKKRIRMISDAVASQAEIRSIMIWLKRYDLPNGLAAKIYKAYEGRAVTVLETNPYTLADDIHGVGFKKADDVAMRLGIARESQFRIRSGVRACLDDKANEGNTCVKGDVLVKLAASDAYLDIDESLVEKEILDRGFPDIVIDGENVFLSRYYHAEKRIAEKLLQLASQPVRLHLPSIDRIEKLTGFTYSDEQRGAIFAVASSDVLVLTGGPGTGKTATTNAIITALEEIGQEVLLAAPTGRAAKRMNEVTSREAKTIHRLLEYSEGKFQRNADNPLVGDALVVDESSMIDTLLMRDLVKAVPAGMKLILVGDVDQLPSVGAGCVLRDVIDSGKIPTVRLTQVFRQAQGSNIIMGAHAVNRGYMPKLDNPPGTDLFFVARDAKEDIAATILRLVSTEVPQKLGFKNEDIQVLTPMKRDGDLIGANELNRQIQAAVNGDSEIVARKGDLVFRRGDRIMQVKNNYDKDVFNGDIGTVVCALSGQDEDKAVMEADFGDNTVRFTQGDLDELELAYACTVHKSQGSEYPVVIMPVHNSHFIMLKRNLVYTGITRARKYCILVGTTEAMLSAVRREDTDRRHTCLAQRLIESKPEEIISTTLF